MHHFGERNLPFSVGARSYLTGRRAIFNFLILVLVNLQEIVHFNTEKTGPKCYDLRDLVVPEDLLQVAQVGLEAQQPNLSEKKLKLLTEPEPDPTLTQNQLTRQWLTIKDLL